MEVLRTAPGVQVREESLFFWSQKWTMVSVEHGVQRFHMVEIVKVIGKMDLKHLISTYGFVCFIWFQMVSCGFIWWI